MESNLKLIENIAENLANGFWTAAVADIKLITHRKTLLSKILSHLEESEGEYYPSSGEAERWLKSIARILEGEYACGNL